MKNTKQVTPPYAVLIFSGTEEGASVLRLYENFHTAEHRRKEWLTCYSRRPDRPTAATYYRLDSADDSEILSAILALSEKLNDRRHQARIMSAVQEVIDRQNGKDF